MPLTSALFESFPCPASLVRWRAKRALRRRLVRLRSDPRQDPVQRRRDVLRSVSAHPGFASGPVRLSRSQLPLEFWRRVLGARLHAGAAFWPRWAQDIHRAEDEWCKGVAERAGLKSGLRVLEIGALPGSLARWAETEIPGLEVTLLALDANGRQLLDSASSALGPVDARVAAATLKDFSAPATFDRVIAVEALTQAASPVPVFDRLLSWLAPGGHLFAQVACHWRDSYHFGSDDEHGWMLPETPDGALYPGEELLGELEKNCKVISRWEWSGEHYERTARAWIERLEAHSAELLSILETAEEPRPRRTLRAWRHALLAQQAMYGYREGQEWCLTQVLLGR
ncbi:MAG: methyltransferase domain-containing protein [bacterium]|nr:methyltransferase domain-containing protein [bacterium]